MNGEGHEGECPFCGFTSGCEHRLATWDAGSRSMSRLDGLAGGSLVYVADEVGDLLAAVRRVALASRWLRELRRWKAERDRFAGWMADSGALGDYLKQVEPAAARCAGIPDAREALWDVVRYTPDHPRAMRRCVDGLLGEAGVRVDAPAADRDVPPHPTVVESWYWESADRAARKLLDHVRSFEPPTPDDLDELHGRYRKRMRKRSGADERPFLVAEFTYQMNFHGRLWTVGCSSERAVWTAFRRRVARNLAATNTPGAVVGWERRTRRPICWTREISDPKKVMDYFAPDRWLWMKGLQAGEGRGGTR